MRNPLRTVAALLIPAALLLGSAAATQASPPVPQSFFLENPYSITGVRANLEIVDLDSDPGGALIMNQYRVDVNLYENFLGVYAKFPFAGVTDFGPTDEDEYSLGNITVGGKLAVLNSENAILSAGFEVLLPTAENDVATLAAQSYVRDLPYFFDETTLNPYVVLAVGDGMWAIQGNFGAEIITDAEEFEGDDTEMRFKYGGTVSVTPPLGLPFSTTIMVEGLAVSTVTLDDNTHDFFITPGIRLGGQTISVGAGVQIPTGENADDFANANYFIDLVVRFGG